jgi:very-short-patch-repair endonuclease
MKRRTLYTQSSAGHFDTPQERSLFSALQNHDGLSEKFEIVPKYVDGPFTLDFALIGERKIDLECDGSQHEIVDGIPVVSDVRRDRYLRDKEWTVVHIPNYRIDAEMDKVIAEIVEEALADFTLMRGRYKGIWGITY